MLIGYFEHINGKSNFKNSISLKFDCLVYSHNCYLCMTLLFVTYNHQVNFLTKQLSAFIFIITYPFLKILFCRILAIKRLTKYAIRYACTINFSAL